MPDGTAAETDLWNNNNRLEWPHAASHTRLALSQAAAQLCYIELKVGKWVMRMLPGRAAAHVHDARSGEPFFS
jgi:hypothetical protein